MRAAIEPRRSPLPVNQPPLDDRSKIFRQIRFLIWTYLILLIFEGALRKWVVPQLSNPILLVRDPVAILIYLWALRAHVFPHNLYVVLLGIIAVLSLLVGIVVLLNYFPFTWILEITLYGFRSNFLHLPLIFVIAKVFDEEDVKKIGWLILLFMIPMSLIMVAQFKASPDAFINRTVGTGEALQLTAGGGKIRPPGTFSFVSGPVFYIPLAVAFAIYGALNRKTYKTWLLIAAGASLVIAIAVSGSRSCVACVILVVLSVGVIFLVRPRAVNQFGRTLVVVVIAGLIMSRLPVFKEGVTILSDRFTTSAEAGDTTIFGSIVGRTIEDFTHPLSVLDKIPILGYGLGLGTSGGARVLIGRAAFLLAEGEWMRILLESGPILGLAFLLWRTVLTLRIGYLTIASLRRGAILPVLLFSCSFLPLLNGQLGQPTSLGFTVFLSGLCLAAMRTTQPLVPPVLPDKTEPALKPLPRRSPYASRLYGPEAGADHTNGLADR
jgi:hypothetical protein